MATFSLNNLVRDSIITSRNFRDVRTFTKKHRLWEGLMNYKWLSKFFIIVALIVSIGLFNVCLNWWQNPSANNFSLSELGNSIGSLFKGGYNLFVIGGLKYIILILAEVIIFHFTRRTMEIVTGTSVDSSFRAFIHAQKRMIVVAIYSFVLESFYSVIFSVAIGLIGGGFIKPVGVFLIQCFFLGFAIVDNYNEIFHMTIKQSFRYTKQYGGVALAIGIPVYILMLMPLIGTIAGPVIGAIVATITMNELLQKDHNMDWVFETK